MSVTDLSQKSSILNQYIREIRDVEKHSDRLRFRKNLERISQLIGYEISKTLDYETVDINTPLAKTKSTKLEDQLVIASILRAGIPMHNGMLSIFDQAENAFISAYRKEQQQGISIEVDYQTSPELTDKTILLVDPMIATGKSIISCLNELLKFGQPKRLIIGGIIAAMPGVDYLKDNLPFPADIYVASIDPKLNDQSYIVPGLGDAGDLAFGNKL